MPIKFGSITRGVRRAVRAGAIGFGAAKRFFGATRARVRTLIADTFNWLTVGETNTTEGLSEAAFQAGRTFGDLTGDIEGQLTSLPIIGDLPESTLQGGRYEFDVNVNFSGISSNRRLVIVGDSGMTAEEIMQAIIEEGNRRADKDGRGSPDTFLEGAEDIGEVLSVDIISAARRF